MSLWQSYKTLQPRTRMLLGAGVMLYAVLGMRYSDSFGNLLGITPTARDEEELKEKMKVRIVER
ncbi:hypothetical protein K470DRAFT_254036 [Piedraia hortae CBS 480.64]|uniref:Uncharacterized protein n=1 Tax=Piedraia hortae CBS 480.64 TaxID=1314780 RepID=A0A6A7CB07_9PEZI|nr:hypothetical protein K470DRAFT_254036 [Piedraia hortae CBS 480.64]